MCYLRHPTVLLFFATALLCLALPASSEIAATSGCSHGGVSEDQESLFEEARCPSARWQHAPGRALEHAPTEALRRDLLDNDGVMHGLLQLEGLYKLRNDLADGSTTSALPLALNPPAARSVASDAYAAGSDGANAPFHGLVTEDFSSAALGVVDSGPGSEAGDLATEAADLVGQPAAVGHADAARLPSSRLLGANSSQAKVLQDIDSAIARMIDMADWGGAGFASEASGGASADGIRTDHDPSKLAGKRQASAEGTIASSVFRAGNEQLLSQELQENGTDSEGWPSAALALGSVGSHRSIAGPGLRASAPRTTAAGLPGPHESLAARLLDLPGSAGLPVSGRESPQLLGTGISDADEALLDEPLPDESSLGREDGGGGASSESSAFLDGEPVSEGRPQNVSSSIENVSPSGFGGAAAATGIDVDSAQDIHAFLITFCISSAAIIACLIAFEVLSRMFPKVYRNNVLIYEELKELCDGLGIQDATELHSKARENNVAVTREQVQGFLDRRVRLKAPRAPLKWISAAWCLQTEDVIHAAGLDQAMLLEFSGLAMKTCLILCVPMVLVMLPLYWFMGQESAEGDILGRLSLANVQEGHWLYDVQAAVVWCVVIVAEKLIFDAMRRFINHDHDNENSFREKWLKEMPEPRSKTVLVEAIPEYCRTDAGLKDIFEKSLGADSVEKAYTVRRTCSLKALIQERDQHRQERDQAVFRQKQREEDGYDRRAHGGGQGGGSAGVLSKTIVELNSKIERLEVQIREERGSIKAAAAGLASGQQEVLSSVGFVTFKHRHQMELAQFLRLTVDDECFRISTPPDPSDVIYEDLYQEHLGEYASLAGYGLVVAVFLGYLPLVLGLTTVTDLQQLKRRSPYIREFADEHKFLGYAYDGIVGSAVLSFVMNLVPPLLSTIFSNFMVLKSKNAWQLLLQRWYTYFLFVFVLLATAIGSSVERTTENILEHPLDVVYLLADTLPMATHFYLNYLMLGWASQLWIILRPFVLTRFVLRRAFTFSDEEEARMKSEPENQNSNGMGARTAGMTLIFVVALVFCSLMPVILLIATVNFFICRVVYGYLTVFAESKKPDLGGAFWPHQLRHVQEGLFIYIALMTGVLLRRASTSYAGALCASALVFQAISYNRFRHVFRWETLPLEHIHQDDDYPKRAASRHTYEQEELMEEDRPSSGPLKGKAAGAASSSASAFGKKGRKSCC